jgi:hypothetical protein
MRRQAVFLLVAAALTLSACGPQKETLVGVRSQVLPITLAGNHPEPAASATPQPQPSLTAAFGPAPLPPPILEFPALSPLPAPPIRPPSACPEAGPLTFPAVAATSFVGNTAPAGTRDYRTTLKAGSVTQNLTQHWVVTETTATGGGGYSFKVTVTSAGRTEATAYTYQADGTQVALARIDFPDGTSYRPLTAVKLLSTPADPNAAAWDSAGADPTSGMAMSYHGQVTGRKRVQACGQLVDSWEVQATARFVGPKGAVDQVITYNFATQYGGLIVRQSVQTTPVGGTTTTEENTINAVP